MLTVDETEPVAEELLDLVLEVLLRALGVRLSLFGLISVARAPVVDVVDVAISRYIYSIDYTLDFRFNLNLKLKAEDLSSVRAL